MEKKSFVSIADKYLERFLVSELEIVDPPKENLSLIIVIPVFNEPNVSSTLTSLFFNQNKYYFEVEVILIVNNAANASDTVKKVNKNTYVFLKEFAYLNNSSKISLYPFYVDNFNPKHAGVGWARKIGMDLALKRFRNLNYNGLIVSLDADATVSSNYLNEINAFFIKSNCSAVSIHFEHPLKGEGYSESHYHYIKLYELHLRYYKNALAFAGFPYAYHTVGSSFALTAAAYARQGGMNRRKAGEDFYFINKLIKGEIFGEIMDAKVIPSPRISDRVPFGTGRALLEAFDGVKNLELTYDFSIFKCLKKWIDFVSIQNFEYDLFPEKIKKYIAKSEWDNNHLEMFKNSASHESYLKRFFTKYDAFWVLKFIHYSRDNFTSNTDLLVNSQSLINQMNLKSFENLDEQLELFRIIDQKKGPMAP
tara:strand:- start:279 stop:1544 length:1266 start_codon:yes stop_codon:yes gene_type:complete